MDYVKFYNPIIKSLLFKTKKIRLLDFYNLLPLNHEFPSCILYLYETIDLKSEQFSFFFSSYLISGSKAFTEVNRKIF